MTVTVNEACTECGQKKPTPVRYPLGYSMVTGLTRLYRSGGGPVTRRDLGLTGVEYSVFHKMTYWHLIEKVSGERWVITDLGRAFIEGRTAVPVAVYAVNGVTVAADPENVTAFEVVR